MRRTWVLTQALQMDCIHSRIQLNGNDTTREELNKILRKHGYDITYRKLVGKKPARAYEGIKIGTAYFGMVVWAKERKDEKKLAYALAEKNLISSECKLPVELRRDKQLL